MAMPYWILEHTADLKMVVSGNTLEELFREAVAGIMNLLRPAIGGAATPASLGAVRTISLTAADPTALLVDFLNEVLACAEINKEVYSELTFKKFSPTALAAELRGRAVSGFQEDIKAVTYHEADVQQNKKGEWKTLLVFDI